MIRSSGCIKCLNGLTRSAPSKHVSNHKDFMLSVLGINLSKEEIWKCPVKQFGGTVHIIDSPEDLERKKIKSVLKKISSLNVVGFDTETAVLFPRRNCNPHLIGLVQIASETDVILWRLRRKKQYIWKSFPQPLKNILSNNKIIKVIFNTNISACAFRAILPKFGNSKLNNLLKTKIILGWQWNI